MGSGGSKPAQQSPFNPDAPIQFSQSVLSSLQENPQTDSTRTRDRELERELRTSSKLTAIRDSQAEELASLTASLTTDAPTEKESSGPPHAVGSLASHFSSPWYQDHSSKKMAASEDSGRSHESVNKEVEELRAKLGQRKKIDKLPAGVENAKASLVNCLRTNDRRPLDCWEEVEKFKAEVGKLEKEFIQKAGR